MTISKLRIIPLATEAAEAARRTAKAGATDHVVITADSPTGYPCRHCLRWARPGEQVVLFPYAAIPPGRPYSETGPIFVHAAACERYKLTREYPEDFRTGRVCRAYNENYDIVNAAVADGDPEAVIERLFENPETAFVDVRSVTHGCYTFRIQRT